MCWTGSRCRAGRLRMPHNSRSLGEWLNASTDRKIKQMIDPRKCERWPQEAMRRLGHSFPLFKLTPRSAIFSRRVEWGFSPRRNYASLHRSPPLMAALGFLGATRASADSIDTFTYTFGPDTFTWDLPASPTVDPNFSFPGNAFYVPGTYSLMT